MVMGCCFICVFAVLINKVCLQETVEAVIGGSVLLPCSSTEHDHKPQDTDVHWKDNEDKTVYSIVKGSVAGQDQQYKNRAEPFPEEYKRGNFSIKLNNLTHTDGGEYICYIIHSYEQLAVQLIINESTAGNESKSTGQEDPEDESGSDSEETSWNCVRIVLIVLSILFIIIGCLGFFFYCWKKKQALSFSSVCTEDKAQ